MNALRYATLAFLLLLSACDGTLVNDELPSSFSRTIKVLTEGSGDSFGQELAPLSAGDNWTFYSPDDYLVQTVSDKTEETNRVASTVVYRANRGYTYKSYYRLDNTAFWDYGDQVHWFPTSIPRLHFPVRVGKKWKVGDNYANLRVEATVEASEEIDTPMGVYRCIKVHYLLRDAADENLQHQWMWFAPGVGIVRWKYDYGWGVGPERSSSDWLLRHFQVSGYEEERIAARVR